MINMLPSHRDLELKDLVVLNLLKDCFLYFLFDKGVSQRIKNSDKISSHAKLNWLKLEQLGLQQRYVAALVLDRKVS